MDYSADVVLWSQGVFGLSEGTLESLVDKLPSFDFAILVLTPDDVAIVRHEVAQLPRDNVLFELGLFMGGLGRERCFIVYDRSSGIRLPSDLAGVTPATFQPHSSGDLVPALGSASTQIESTVAKLGPRSKGAEDVYIDANTQYRVIADLLEASSHQFFILMHEQGVADSPRRLDVVWRASGILARRAQGNGPRLFSPVNDMCRKLADAGLLTQDLGATFTLTERGHAFADWLTNSGYKAEYFRCDYGTWGTRPKELEKTEHVSSAPQSVIELQERQKQQNEPPA